jgi:hypothetical protein
MESITRFITQKLKLKVNETKSAVGQPQERKFLGFSFTAGPEIKRVIAPKALDRFKRRIREITRKAKGRQHREDDRGTGLVYAGLARLLRLLRNACGAGVPDPLGSAATTSRFVATVENTTPSPGGSVGLGSSTATGQQHGRQRSWPLVPRKGQSPFGRAFQCILQIAWASDVD